MRTDQISTVSGDKDAGWPTSDNGAAVRVLAAVWCRSVGTSWTLELHQLGPGMAAGTIEAWINSGIPITQPEPDALTRELLARHGLHLFRDSSAGPGARSRHRIGYASRNAELIKVADLLRNTATGTGVHPVMLAARWVGAGFSTDAAAEWKNQPAHPPSAVPHQRRVLGGTAQRTSGSAPRY